MGTRSDRGSSQFSTNYHCFIRNLRGRVQQATRPEKENEWIENFMAKKSLKKATKGTRNGYIKIFRDKKKLEEMLDLAKAGASWSSLARKYKVDHTSIRHRCLAAGLPGKKRTKEEIEREKREAEIAEKKRSKFLRGVFHDTKKKHTNSVTIWKKLKRDIAHYLFEEKLTIGEVASMYCISPLEIVEYCKRLKIDIVSMSIDAEGGEVKRKYTEEGTPIWRPDIIEGKICLGKTQEARKREIKRREEAEQREKRKSLLSY